MRRLIPLVLLGMLLVGALPAGAAQPVSTDTVTWTLDGGGTVTLDTSTSLATVSIESELWVECAGASALTTVELSGTGTMDQVAVDRHGRSGSFSGTLELTPVVVFGGCGDYAGPTLTGSISGDFETAKGKAERWRDGSDRFIKRSGSGTLSVHSLVNTATAVEVVTTISS